MGESLRLRFCDQIMESSRVSLLLMGGLPLLEAAGREIFEAMTM